MDDSPLPEAFCVLVNSESQYCLWPAAVLVPEGWTQVGPTGRRDICLAFVEANWADMRPRSLRDVMAVIRPTR